MPNRKWESVTIGIRNRQLASEAVALYSDTVAPPFVRLLPSLQDP
jgi:hypothetical protein